MNGFEKRSFCSQHLRPNLSNVHFSEHLNLFCSTDFAFGIASALPPLFARTSLLLFPNCARLHHCSPCYAYKELVAPSIGFCFFDSCQMLQQLLRCPLRTLVQICASQAVQLKVVLCRFAPDSPLPQKQQYFGAIGSGGS